MIISKGNGRMGATYVDVTAIAVGVELVVVSNVHAVVVGVERTQAELHADNIRNGTAVLDMPALVVADNGNPAAAVRVVLPHERGRLLGKGLAGGRPVFEREELVQHGVDDAASGLAGGARVVADNLRVGAGVHLALAEVHGGAPGLL